MYPIYSGQTPFQCGDYLRRHPCRHDAAREFWSLALMIIRARLVVVTPKRPVLDGLNGQDLTRALAGANGVGNVQRMPHCDMRSAAAFQASNAPA